MEIWKDIRDYEKLYQVSNEGRVRTHKEKITTKKDGTKRHWQQRVLKQKKCKNDCLRVTLWKDGKPKDFLVARLVGDAFLEQLRDTNMTINHIDGNRLNNFSSNLEWVTRAENIRLAFETGLMTTQIAIRITNKETKEVKYFRSMAKASEFLGKNKGYVSAKIKLNIFENDKYVWRII